MPSFADGHLCCFYVLAVVNNATMNIRVYVHFQNMVIFRCMARIGIARSYGNSIFSFFYVNSILFSLVVLQKYIPSNCVGEFPFLYILSSIYFFVEFLMMAVLVSVRWYLIIVLMGIYLIINDVDIFSCAFGHLSLFFGEISI